MKVVVVTSLITLIIRSMSDDADYENHLFEDM
jgi:hypothetical protein